MEFSVIIPTYNRVKDLNECLNSILVQTTLPREILIIDNSDRDNAKVEKLIKQLTPLFDDKNICLRYIQNKKENSLTVAKNIGVESSSREIISFLDDDVILDERYYEEILKIYKKYPYALGVEGRVMAETNVKKMRFVFSQILGKLFYSGFVEKDKCRVLPSFGVTYSLGDNIINCEWLSGAATFKRSVLEKIKPDENLKKYSDNEDIDLSYRIFKKYPNVLFLTPYAKYWHKLSREGRLLRKELIFMSEIYRLYLFYKNIEQNPKNKLIYLWSRIGNLIFNIGRSVFESSRAGLIENIYVIEAYTCCIRHLEEIKQGKLDFLNEALKGS